MHLEKVSLLPKYLASAPQWLERLLSLAAVDPAGEGRLNGINTAAENEANLVAPLASDSAQVINSPREEANEYEPKIDQSGRVSFSPDPTGQKSSETCRLKLPQNRRNLVTSQHPQRALFCGRLVSP